MKGEFHLLLIGSVASLHLFQARMIGNQKLVQKIALYFEQFEKEENENCNLSFISDLPLQNISV